MSSNKSFQVQNISGQLLTIGDYKLLHGESATLEDSPSLMSIYAAGRISIVEKVSLPDLTVSPVPKEDIVKDLPPAPALEPSSNKDRSSTPK